MRNAGITSWRQRLPVWSTLLIVLLGAGNTTLVQAEGGGLPVSNRLSINLGETPWQYLKDSDP
jgi:hypothetical protein